MSFLYGFDNILGMFISKILGLLIIGNNLSIILRFGIIWACPFGSGYLFQSFLKKKDFHVYPSRKKPAIGASRGATLSRAPTLLLAGFFCIPSREGLQRKAHSPEHFRDEDLQRKARFCFISFFF